MAFILILIGALMTTVGVRNTQDDLAALVKGDFTGAGNFFDWIVALFIIGAIGYIPELKKISNGLLVLVMLVLFISNKGFFKEFSNAITRGSGNANGQSAGGTIGATLP